VVGRPLADLVPRPELGELVASLQAASRRCGGTARVRSDLDVLARLNSWHS